MADVFRVAMLLLIGSSIARGEAHIDDARLRDTADGRDWAAYGRTYGEQHFSPLSEINRDTIGGLKLAWYVDLPLGNSVTAPLAVDGVLYTATGYSVVRAFDAATGKKLWEFDPQAPQASPSKLHQGWGSRGLAYWQGKIYTGTNDGRLIAIEASSGKAIWSVLTVDPNDVRYITGAPRIFAGKVIVGHGGADVGSIRGYVTAYDAETGRQLWRFYTVPGNPASDKDETTRIAAKTWAGEWWKRGGGGTVWNAMTYDAEFDQVLIGVGNGSPWNYHIRSESKGDNLFLTAIVALDARTGSYKWHYQTNPAESWDYNASMDMEIATLSIEGKPRKIVLQAPKNGFFYVIDRTNGKLISAEPIATVNWASKIDLATGRPVERPGIRYENGTQTLMWPGPSGGHSWQPMSFDPRTAITYVPIIELPVQYDDRGIDPKTWERPGGAAMDNAVNLSFQLAEPKAGTGALVAWNAATQKEVWRVTQPHFWNGGTMATAGDLVFQGRAEGSFDAYDSASGKRLWSFQAGTGVIAPPITYQVKGHQYITVLSGFGTSGAGYSGVVASLGWQYRTQPRRILTFSLGGAAGPLPPPQPVFAKPIADSQFKPDSELAQKGAIIYGRRCAVCHGVDTKAAGLAPDLRESPIPQDAMAFEAIVYKGALVPNGMPSFKELADQDLAALRQFLRTAADDLRKTGTKGEPPAVPGR